MVGAESKKRKFGSDDDEYVPSDESDSDSDASVDTFEPDPESDHSENEGTVDIAEMLNLTDESHEINKQLRFLGNERVKRQNEMHKQTCLPHVAMVEEAERHIKEYEKQLPNYVSFAEAESKAKMFDKERDKCVKHNKSNDKAVHVTKRGRVSKSPQSFIGEQKVTDTDRAYLNKMNRDRAFAICGTDYLFAETSSHIVPCNYNTFSKLCDKYLSGRTIMMVDNGSPCVLCTPDIHKLMELEKNTPKFSIQPNGKFFVFTTDELIINRLRFSGIVHDEPVPFEWCMLATVAQRIFWLIHFCEAVSKNT